MRGILQGYTETLANPAARKTKFRLWSGKPTVWVKPRVAVIPTGQRVGDVGDFGDRAYRPA